MEPGTILTHQPSNGVHIKVIILIDLSSASATIGRPAGIDLVDYLAISNKELGKSPSIIPSAFDTPVLWL
jgi:hypothetical protein